MDEFFRTGENQRYAENYRCEEYNRVTEDFSSAENFRTSETNAERTEAGSSSSGSSRSSDKKRETAKRNLLSSTVMLPAVGTVAGATLIFAAVVAVIKVALMSLVVSAGAISAVFSVENPGNASLTAYLTGGGESYACRLDGNGDKYFADFRLLDPDTEYSLDVRDGDGKSYFSETYRTAPYEEKLHPVENAALADAILVQFDESSMPLYEYEVYLDKQPVITDFSAENPILQITELSPFTSYDLRITDGLTGDLLFMREYVTESAVSLRNEILNAKEYRGEFDKETLPAGELLLYVDGELRPERISADGDNRVTVENLWAGRTFEVSLRDADTGKAVFGQKFTAPDVYVEVESAEIAAESAVMALYLQSGTAQTLGVYVHDSAGAIVSYELLENVDGAFTVSVPTRYFAGGIKPESAYETRIECGDETVFEYAFVTSAYIEIDPQYILGEETSEDGRKILLLERAGDDQGIVVTYSATVEGRTGAELTCTSDSGLQLPLSAWEMVNKPGCAISTLYDEFALSGEVYALALSAFGEESQAPAETVYFRVVDGEGGEVLYPEFQVSKDVTGDGYAVFDVTCNNAELIADENGETICSLFVYSYGECVDILYSQDFVAMPMQRLQTDIADSTEFVVEIHWEKNGRTYLIHNAVFSSR